MLRTLAVFFTLMLLTACMTTDRNVSASKAEKLRNARASATSVTLGTGY